MTSRGTSSLASDIVTTILTVLSRRPTDAQHMHGLVPGCVIVDEPLTAMQETGTKKIT
jgi:hypothetical protein